VVEAEDLAAAVVEAEEEDGDFATRDPLILSWRWANSSMNANQRWCASYRIVKV
jgi:hypothetical protein